MRVFVLEERWYVNFAMEHPGWTILLANSLLFWAAVFYLITKATPKKDP